MGPQVHILGEFSLRSSEEFIHLPLALCIDFSKAEHRKPAAEFESAGQSLQDLVSNFGFV